MDVLGGIVAQMLWTRQREEGSENDVVNLAEEKQHQ
jgi:hypothetical protein